MAERCHYCGKQISRAHFDCGIGIRIGQDRYAHTGCIESHIKDNTMNDLAQHILGAADSAHQGIDLARSLLQESLGNMGEILTQGCESLGTASLGSTMRLGQQLKESSSRLAGLLSEARGLCVLLGKDLGVCEDKVTVLYPGPERPSDRPQYLFDVLGCEPDDLGDNFPASDDLNGVMASLYERELEPGEDEFDDDEQPF